MPGEETDFVTLLREASGELARARLSPDARARIGSRLAGDRRGATRHPALVPAMMFMAGAALALLLARPDRRGPLFEPGGPASAIAAAGFGIDRTPCTASHEVGALALAGPCRVRDEHLGLTVVVRRKATLVRLDDGVRLVDGGAEFEVAHVGPERPPLRVHVSGGIIEVIGTRFIVEQDRSGGHVDLLTGRIRFTATDGGTTDIAPGSRLAWRGPVRPSAPPPPRPASSATLAAHGREAAPGSGVAAAARPAEPIVTPSPAASQPAEPIVTPSSAVPPRSSVAPQRDPVVAPLPEPVAPPRSSAAPPWSVAPQRDPVVAPLPEPVVGPSTSARAPSAVAPVADRSASLAAPTTPHGADEVVARVRALRGRGRYREAFALLASAAAASAWPPRTAEVVSFEQGDLLEHMGDDAAICAHWRAHLARFPGGIYRDAVQDYLVRRCR